MIVPETYASNRTEHVEVFVSVDISDVISQAIVDVCWEHICQCACVIAELFCKCFGFWPWELCWASWLFRLVWISLFTERAEGSICEFGDLLLILEERSVGVAGT